MGKPALLHRRVWHAMRQMRRFSLSTLVMVTETKPDLARRYAHVLRRAGYLVERAGKFILARDTGPRPPLVLQHDEPGRRFPIGVLDRNTGQRFGLDGAEPPAAKPPRPVQPLPRRSRRAARQSPLARLPELEAMRGLSAKRLWALLRERSINVSLRTAYRYAATLRRQRPSRAADGGAYKPPT